VTNKTKQIVKLALVAGAVLSISACASRPKPTPLATTNTPPPPMSHEAPPPMSESQAGPIPGSTQDFVINAGDRVYFDFNSYSVRADGTGILDRQAEWLQRYPGVRVRIEGNCDERGTREYNFALGARRANAVREYLVARGVAGGRIETVSYGKERPIDPSENDDAFAHNRNGHTALTAGAQ
jgi:peptidoglycan-associated lipoprotein